VRLRPRQQLVRQAPHLADPALHGLDDLAALDLEVLELATDRVISRSSS